MEPLIQQQFTDTARRDQRLLNLAYRRARRMGDYRGALQAATMGDQMGLRVGTSGNDQELKGTGFQRMRNAFAMNGMGVPATGLDAFDFRHSNQGGPGVGGYNFNQGQRQMPAGAESGGQIGYIPGFNGPNDTITKIANSWEEINNRARREKAQKEGSYAIVRNNDPGWYDTPDGIVVKGQENLGLIENIGTPPNVSGWQPGQPAKAVDLSPTKEEVAQFQRERRIYGSGAKVPDLQKPSEEDQGIALRIAQRRNYLKSLQNPIDKSFGVPEIGTRISDMGGRGVAQNPQFSPSAWRRFDEQQALEKATYDSEIERQYQQRIKTIPDIQTIVHDPKDYAIEGSIIFPEAQRIRQPKIVSVSKTSKDASPSTAKFEDQFSYVPAPAVPLFSDQLRKSRLSRLR